MEKVQRLDGNRSIISMQILVVGLRYSPAPIERCGNTPFDGDYLFCLQECGAY